MSDQPTIEDSPDAGYRCTCPPAASLDEDIEQALACWEREQEWNRRHTPKEER